MEFEKVRSVISEQLNVSEDSITMDTLFAKDLNADSLDILQIISELEDIYDIEFTNESAEKIKTVGDAVNYIKGLS